MRSFNKKKKCTKTKDVLKAIRKTRQYKTEIKDQPGNTGITRHKTGTGRSSDKLIKNEEKTGT